MAIALADLKSFIGASGVADDGVLSDCLAEGQALVDKYVGTVWDEETQTYIPRSVPTPILERAYLEVAADLWNRRQAPNGIANQQFATLDGIASAPIRIARDPMQAAYKILGRWVQPW